MNIFEMSVESANAAYIVAQTKAADEYLAYTTASEVAAAANAEMERVDKLYLSAREATNDAYRDYRAACVAREAARDKMAALKAALGHNE